MKNPFVGFVPWLIFWVVASPSTWEYAASGVLAVVVLGTLAFIPFTEQYARESAPREVWDTPRFKRVNFALTLAWGLVFAVSAVLGVIAQEVDDGRDWLNWIIPIALVVGAFKFTAWYPEQVRREEGGGPASPAAAPVSAPTRP